LLSLALECEHGQQVPLAIAANLLRVLDDRGQRLRDVPGLSGVSKEGLSMALGVLEKAGLAVVERDPGGSRFKHVRLTPSGFTAQAAYRRRLAEVEVLWQQHAGAGVLREALLRTTGDGARLALGLEPYPDGWRAALPRPATLPHFPMVLHRGGFPDGS
jgi:DNA-binding MarR family transcriptional regulator